MTTIRAIVSEGVEVIVSNVQWQSSVSVSLSAISFSTFINGSKRAMATLPAPPEIYEWLNSVALWEFWQCAGKRSSFFKRDAWLINSWGTAQIALTLTSPTQAQMR